MFQYAMGRSLAVSSGQRLKLDLSGLQKYKLRDYELNQFQIKAAPLGKWERKIRKNYGSLAFVRALVPAARCVDVEEDGLPFKSHIKALKTPAYLNGYWQSEKYFDDIADVIRSDFTLKSDFTPQRLAVLSKIKTSTVAVSVHVRRGDYVSNPKANATHGTCEPDWYDAAMARMADKYNKPDFFVFSDDIAWAIENLPSHPSMSFVEPQQDGKDVQDMHLMAACRSHIVANSSFSWWGAWLNPGGGKHVIAPAQWFRSPDLDARDVVPGRWERL
ncbi:alpha-1,2-fucosyltransferase [Roseibium sp. M-1]